MICIICDNMACLCQDSYDNTTDSYLSSPNYVSKNARVERGVHIMNKNEAKECRRLMSETGLSEKELREHKVYRRLLSDAQKKGAKELDYYGKHNRTKKRLMKQATKLSGLAKEHPKNL